MKKIIFLVFIIYGCNSNDSEGLKPMNYSFAEKYSDTILVSNLSNKILINGDTIAFRELESIYMISEHSEEFLYFSTVMAEKHGFVPAYLTNYHILKNSKNTVFKKIAIFNLLKAYEMGDNKKIDFLNEKFPNGIPKSKEFMEQL